MLFEVAASNGARTHAGVLEFTSEVPEGVVLLPEKVQNSLWGLPASAPDHQHGEQQPQQGVGAGSSSGSSRGTSPSEAAGPGPSSAANGSGMWGGGGSSRCSGTVHVAYRRLEKGTYVRLQPELRAFHEEVGADPEAMKAALEDGLHAVSTLTEGDWVQVRDDWQEAVVSPPPRCILVILLDICI